MKSIIENNTVEFTRNQELKLVNFIYFFLQRENRTIKVENVSKIAKFCFDNCPRTSYTDFRLNNLKI
jgi:hypothetical protein